MLFYKELEGHSFVHAIFHVCVCEYVPLECKRQPTLAISLYLHQSLCVCVSVGTFYLKWATRCSATLLLLLLCIVWTIRVHIGTFFKYKERRALYYFLFGLSLISTCYNDEWECCKRVHIFGLYTVPVHQTTHSLTTRYSLTHCSVVIFEACFRYALTNSQVCTGSTENYHQP